MPTLAPPNVDLSTAARRVIVSSLGVATGERVAIVCDRANTAVADALARVVGELGGTTARVVLEDLAPRPQVHAGPEENVPSGEVVTCPGDVNGRYVANGTLGDATGSFAGSLTKGAVVLHVEGGVVKRVDAGDSMLARRMQVTMRGVPNLDRVAL